MSGSDVFNALNSVQMFFDEIDSLCEDLRKLVINEVERRGNLRPLKDNINQSYRESENKSIITDCCFSIPLKRRAKGNQLPFAYLAFQVSVVGRGANVALEPLLHVCLWEEPVTVGGSDEYCFEFPIDKDSLVGMRNVEGRLVTWHNDEKWLPFTWTYSIKLFDIKNKEAIKKLVVDPVMGLLGIDINLSRDDWEERAKEALPEALVQRGVLEYQDEWLGLSQS